MTKKITLTGIYFFLLLVLVILNPMRFEHPVPIYSRLRIHPLADTLRDLSYANSVNSFKGWFNFLGNIFGNIIIFIPFAFIMVRVFNIQKFFPVVMLGFAFSVAIEVTQYVTGLGVADVNDVILNTAGAAIGFYLCKSIFRWKRKE
jgi:glycopeptide antibiotics resistance protein